ncbi:hypothetical protein [Pseudoteredinibacter isoporae]|uniref:Uncharacterized protein n=1 Tax=Pseudoteredinibacter isoporae TaxID=570281 RepID=A0A7X0JRF0_9GAMM|nr:hypothetical protein [Pseudoteredinibacter isoporae]MBB6520026.1 hypothetical protein [Pseudoteredinibacter isoporae]NHO85598.1 hypothetical protein [Pseudoteredinibacter isoporae]NIB25950.1 hypothetical protein [Pseudoteredinibacter isoporae]
MRVVITFLAVCFFTEVNAGLPLALEDLITNKGKIKLSTSISYLNSSAEDIQLGEQVIVQVDNNSFLNLPSSIGETKTNTDTLIGTVGLRYGALRDLEVYARSSYVYRDTRSFQSDGINSQSFNDFASTWFGTSYQFSYDNESPALLGFLETSVYEKSQGSTSSFDSWSAGVTTYRAIDPVVLSMSAAYQWNADRELNGQIVKPGGILSINPSLAFAVNDRITLTTGVQWRLKARGEVDFRKTGFRQTDTGLSLGLGYGFARGNILNVSLFANTSGRRQSNLRFNWLYAF